MKLEGGKFSKILFARDNGGVLEAAQRVGQIIGI